MDPHSHVCASQKSVGKSIKYCTRLKHRKRQKALNKIYYRGKKEMKNATEASVIG